MLDDLVFVCTLILKFPTRFSCSLQRLFAVDRRWWKLILVLRGCLICHLRLLAFLTISSILLLHLIVCWKYYRMWFWSSFQIFCCLVLIINMYMYSVRTCTCSRSYFQISMKPSDSHYRCNTCISKCHVSHLWDLWKVSGCRCSQFETNQLGVSKVFKSMFSYTVSSIVE